MRLEIKTTIILALTIAVIALSTCKGCLQKKYDALKIECANKKDATEKVVTRVDSFPVFLPEQHPIKEGIKLVRVIVPRVDSFITYEFPDTTELSRYKTAYYELLTQYNTENQYADTAIFKNGIAIVSNTVKQNKLQDQKTILDSIRQDIITRTIRQPIRKATLYLGMDAYGNKNELLTGAGASLLYTSPRSLGYEIGTYFTSQQTLNFRASIKFPLTKK